MLGKTIYINTRTGRAVVQLEPDDCSIVDLLEASTIKPGDVLGGDLRSCTNQVVSLTQGQRAVAAFIRGTYCSRDHALKEARRRLDV